MDFVLKSSAWGLTELGAEDDNNLAARTGSNRLGGQKNGGFSIDLGLGRLGDLGDVTVDNLKESRGSTVASSPSRLSKRARAVNGTQKMSCLVDGCVLDLSNCREYHRRHRVCERHSKTPVVMVGGREQRFCQQCSRFHCLGEFDEVKRSCRKRLDGHNRRRRKPQPESLYMSSQSFLSNHQGPRMLQFSDPQAYTTTTGSSNLTWPTTDKHQQQFHVIVQQSMCSNPSSGRNKQFPFLLANYPEKSNQEVPEVSISGQLLNTVASPENPKTSKSDKLTHLVESKRALSLLSTHPTQFNGLPRYSRSQGMEEKPMGEVLVADTINTNDHSNWMFEVGPDGLLENEVSQQVCFSWN